MRLIDLIESIDVTSKQFRTWFRGSKVVDGRRPLVCFHGTHMNHEIEPGGNQHFGTFQAANDRIKDLYDLIRDKAHDSYPSDHVSTPSVYPVYLSIKNPLSLEDSEWHDSDVISELAKRGLISFETMQTFIDGENEEDWIGLVKRLGYDGVRYFNEHEDAGSSSWYPFSDHQVWNIFADRPY